MSRMQDRIDVLAEINAWDRIWALDDTRLNLELSKAGLDAERLAQELQTVLGLFAPTAPGGVALPDLASHEPSRASPTAIAAGAPSLAVSEAAGRVKFFNASRGFGFFEPDGGGGDVMVHILHLRDAGYQTAHEGARIHALVHRTAKGLQVTRILSVDQSTAVHPSLLPQRIREKVQAESDWVSASVKWYNREKGYGFVCEGEGLPECMVHADTLQRWGVAPLCPKQVVEIRWGTSSKGRKVAEIRYPGGGAGFPPVH